MLDYANHVGLYAEEIGGSGEARLQRRQGQMFVRVPQIFMAALLLDYVLGLQAGSLYVHFARHRLLLACRHTFFHCDRQLFLRGKTSNSSGVPVMP